MIQRYQDMDSGQKALLVTGLSILLLVVFYVYLMSPVLAQLNRIPELQLEQKQEYNTSLLQIEHLKSVKKESAKTLVELTKLDQMMPESKSLPSLIVDLQEIADNAGVTFVSIKPNDVEPRNRFIELPIQLIIDSQFYELVDFLYQLEKTSRRIMVTQVFINEGETKLPNIRTTLECSAFMYDEKSVEINPNQPPVESAPAPQTGAASGQ